MGAAGAPLRILLVDADVGFRAAVRRALTGWSVSVVLEEAGAAGQALEMLKRVDYDCVLVNQRLPDMTGTDLVAAVTGIEGPACILIDWRGGEEVALTAVERGAADYFSQGELSCHGLWQAITYTHTLSTARRTQREAQVELQRLALHDALTGLPNRLLFHTLLEKAMAHASREGLLVAVGKVDLDHFQLVNETYGHGIGDQVLKVAGERLRQFLRGQDTAARLGGDEFAVIVTNLHAAAELEAVAERLTAALRAPIDLDGGRIWIGASLGFCFGTDDADVEGLLTRAGIALYRAKIEGRNRSCRFTSDLDAEIRRRRSVQRLLPEALDRRELLVHYQPQVCLATGAIVGLEALVRWRHPEDGILLPAEFLTIACQIGLLGRIGDFVVDTVCAQIRAWLDRGLEVHPVAVNLAPPQLARADVVGVFGDALTRWRVPASRLRVEVTEDVFLESDRTGIKASLEGLRALGIEIAIDDFGTGYASLAELRGGAFSCLKIDRSFVRDIEDDDEAGVIVRSVVGLARALGKQVIAEGVETEAQAERLRGFGVPAVQGFLYGRPMAADEAGALLPRLPASSAGDVQVESPTPEAGAA